MTTFLVCWRHIAIYNHSVAAHCKVVWSHIKSSILRCIGQTSNFSATCLEYPLVNHVTRSKMCMRLKAPASHLKRHLRIMNHWEPELHLRTKEHSSKIEFSTARLFPVLIKWSRQHAQGPWQGYQAWMKPPVRWKHDAWVSLTILKNLHWFVNAFQVTAA